MKAASRQGVCCLRKPFFHEAFPMINIVFATLDCCMTTSTTKIAEDICTKLKLELCINENKVTTNLQDKHLGRLVTCGILTLEVVLTPCICYCIMMINTTSICLNILKTLRMTELMMYLYDNFSLFMRNLASSLTGCTCEHASSHHNGGFFQGNTDLHPMHNS